MKNVIILFYPKTWIKPLIPCIPHVLLYLERMIRHLDVEIILIDEHVQTDYIPIIEKVKDRVLLACVSAMTGYQIVGGINFSKFIKSISNSPVVWGGWHSSLFPEQVLDEEFVDYVIIGQGEIPFQSLVKKILNNESVNDIKGLAFKNDGLIKVNIKECLINPNSFPKANYDLLDLNNYVFNGFLGKTILFFTSYGCPFNCVFCSMARIFERKWFHKEIEEIITDLKHLKKKLGINAVRFEDAIFFVNREFTIQFCQALLDNNLEILWYSNAHVSLFLKLFSDNDISLMYKSGLRQIIVGAESGDQQVLDLINKKSTVGQNLEIVRLLKNHNIITRFSTIIGFPLNPDKDIRLTLKMIMKAKLINRDAEVAIHYLVPFPGTEIYDIAIKNGYIPPANLKDWADFMFKRFDPPWLKNKHRRKIELFNKIYFPLIDPSLYKIAFSGVFFVFIINKIYYPIVYLRFRFSCLIFPVEAIALLYLIKFINKIFKSNYHLDSGYSKYID